MSPDTFNDTQAQASEALAEHPLIEELSRKMRRELAAETVRAEMAEMEAAGKVLQMTDEELRLLRSFRRFKLTAKKPGAVFKWQTRPDGIDPVLVDASQGVHITDPQDVSANG